MSNQIQSPTELKPLNNNELFQMPACACGSCNTKETPSHEHEHEHDHSHSHEHGNLKVFLLRLLTSFILLILLEFTTFFDSFSFPVYLFAYFLAGYEVLFSAAKNILKGQIFDENFLMALASIGALLIGVYSEAVAVLIFYGLGELMQEAAVAKSKKNIEDLMDIRPDIAHIKTVDGIKSVAPEEVEINAILIVRPGEKIPLDGKVLKGSSYLDTRALTGESVPRKVSENDEVLSGSINTEGLLEIVVTKTFGESTVSKILKLVQYAGAKKAKSEKFITKFARYYTPFVVVLALCIAFIPPLLGFGNFDEWVYKALSFLIISCPCALVLSIPISFFGGIGGAAKNGILIKGGNYLESLYHVDTLVFDKTGTLTKGSFKVSEILPEDSISSDELLALAAECEAHSSHPIALAIVEKHNSSQVDTIKSKEDISIKEVAGKGIIAKINSDEIRVGNLSLLQEIGIENLKQFAQTAVYLAKNNTYLGAILIEDEIKEDAKQAISALKNEGVKSIVMLTGDTDKIAQYVAAQIGIDEVKSSLLPHEKVNELEAIMTAKQSGKTAFVGDGINDAPVLTRADIGFAMGGLGSDAAIEAADIVIMNDDIQKIATSLKIAKKTRQIVIQNIVFCLGVKAAIMLLALFGITSIWFAVFADVGVAIIAIMNAMRAMLVK